MDRGNRVVIYASVPAELKHLAILYQIHRRKQSFAEALIELLETHPEIDKIARHLYSSDKNAPTGEAVRP
jgi:hypothetical protein